MNSSWVAAVAKRKARTGGSMTTGRAGLVNCLITAIRINRHCTVG